MTWAELRWGLQLIAEEGIGRRIVAEVDEEDAAMSNARRALGG